MRIPEKLVRSGYFWLPNETAKKLGGTLTISNGGDIRLELLGLFGNNPFDDTPIQRIVGLVEGGDLVTLEECLYTTRNLFDGGLMKSNLFVHRALVGNIAFDQDENVLLDNLRFSTDGLEQWLGKSGLNMETDIAKGSIEVKYQAIPAIEVQVDEDWCVAFGWTWKLSGGPSTNEARIVEQAHVTLRSNNPQPLKAFISLAHRICNFLAFGIDATVSITNVIARASLNDRDDPVPLQVFFQSISFSERLPKTDWFRMLFRFPQIQDDVGTIIQNWLRIYDSHEPTLALYFASRMGAYGFVNSRFLALAQAVESYHRRTSDETAMPDKPYRELALWLLLMCPPQHQEWLKTKLTYGNEISLAARLRRVIEPFEEHLGSDPERMKMIKKIAATRNYLTHYDETLKNRAARSGSELLSLCMNLEALIQLHLLTAIGFNTEQTHAIIERSDSLRAKLAGRPV